MKYFGPVFIVVALLLSAAVYYNVKSPDSRGASGQREVGLPVIDGNVVISPTGDGEPVVSAVSAGVLTLDAALSHGYLAKDGQGSNVYTSFDITAAEQKGTVRPTVNVSVVIDRSGSMHGQAMRDAKQAAQNFVERLGNGDSVSIVSFSDNIRVDFPANVLSAANRGQIAQAIDRIHADGGTNISGGFEAGVKQLQRYRDGRSVDRLILLTDGMPNYGLTATPQLVELTRQHQREGVTLTAIGFGLDYNEDLMAAMADAGAGNYYYARDREAVAEAFTAEFQQLSNIVARRTVLRVELANGVRVADVYGYTYEQKGAFVEVPLAEFYSGQNKSILMQLHASTSKVGAMTIADVRLDYEDSVKEKGVTQQVSLAAVVTQDSGLLETMLNTDVLTRVEEINIAESVKVAMTQYSQGDTEQAKETLREQEEKTSAFGRMFKLESKPKFQKASKEVRNDLVFFDSAPAPASAEGRSAVKSKKARGRAVSRSGSAEW